MGTWTDIYVYCIPPDFLSGPTLKQYFYQLTIFRDFAADHPLLSIFSHIEYSSGIVINKKHVHIWTKRQIQNVQSSAIHNI